MNPDRLASLNAVVHRSMSALQGDEAPSLTDCRRLLEGLGEFAVEVDDLSDRLETAVVALRVANDEIERLNTQNPWRNPRPKKGTW